VVEDIVPLFGIVFLFGGGALVGVAFSPIGTAIAERLRGKRAVPHVPLEELDELREQVSALQHQVSELAERQDFAERVLAQHKDRGALGAGRDGA
jgi:uncharacterized protein with ACT and thioredoxin-like domain